MLAALKATANLFLERPYCIVIVYYCGQGEIAVIAELQGLIK